nr:DUF645 family protein [Vibrio metoecus]
MFNTQSLVSQKAASSLCFGFLCRGFLTVDQLSLDRFRFWQSASQLLALDVCLSDAFA